MSKSYSMGPMSKYSRRGQFRRYALCSVASAALYLTAYPVHAQDASQDASTETVTVTGTRIQRDGYSALPSRSRSSRRTNSRPRRRQTWRNS